MAGAVPGVDRGKESMSHMHDAWRKRLFEKSGHTNESCQEPRCDETSSLSNKAAIFSLAWIAELK